MFQHRSCITIPERSAYTFLIFTKTAFITIIPIFISRKANKKLTFLSKYCTHPFSFFGQRIMYANTSIFDVRLSVWAKWTNLTEYWGTIIWRPSLNSFYIKSRFARQKLAFPNQITPRCVTISSKWSPRPGIRLFDITFFRICIQDKIVNLTFF